MENINIHEQTDELTQQLQEYIFRMSDSMLPKYEQVDFELSKRTIFLSHN